MTKLGLALICVFVLALGAGVMGDRLATRLAVASPGSGGHGGWDNGVGERSTLSADLGLSASQQEQMRNIWEGVRDLSHDSFEQAQILQNERDAKVVDLLSDDQRKSYQELARSYADQVEALKKKRDAAFAKAVEDTRRLLNDFQRQKYDKILNERLGRVSSLYSAPGDPASLNNSAGLAVPGNR